MRTTPARRLLVAAVALLTASAALPAAAAGPPTRQDRPAHGGLSAVIRYTEYGVPHILAEDYADLGFGTGWAQAADQVCTLADGFVTVRGDRSRFFGPAAATDFSLSSAGDNLSSDLYFRGVRQSRTVEKLLAEPTPLGPSRQVKDLMRGFAAGYDTWLAHHRITDPSCAGADWVRPISALDVATRYYALSVLGGQGGAVDEITGAEPPTGPTATPAATDPSVAAQALVKAVRAGSGTADMGSNAVAFSGATTANGRGLLLVARLGTPLEAPGGAPTEAPAKSARPS